MSTSTSQAISHPPTTQAALPPAPVQQGGPRRMSRFRHVLGMVVAVLLAALTVLAVIRWWHGRAALSITDDAFVEAHIVNVAPEVVSGRIVRLLVDEDDRVERGQVLAEIDPIPYRDKVQPGRVEAGGRAGGSSPGSRPTSRGSGARCRSRSRSPGGRSPPRRPTGPRRSRRWSSPRTTSRRGSTRPAPAGRPPTPTWSSPRPTTSRFANLERKGSSTRHELDRSSGLATPRRPTSSWPRPRLAKAIAGRTQVTVARRSLDAARTAAQKAAKGVDLAETGNDQIRVVELLVEVKKEAVEEARRALEAAEHDLAYTEGPRPVPRRGRPAVPPPRRLRLGGRRGAEHVQPRTALRHGQPGGDPPARRRARRARPGSTSTPSPSRSGAASSGSTSRPGPSSP